MNMHRKITTITGGLLTALVLLLPFSLTGCNTSNPGNNSTAGTPKVGAGKTLSDCCAYKHSAQVSPEFESCPRRIANYRLKTTT
jgi:hypothetical protein